VLAPGDFNGDGQVNADDWPGLPGCISGPLMTVEGAVPACARLCGEVFDLDADMDVDLHDVSMFQSLIDP
jgi:hypothetical protein